MKTLTEWKDLPQWACWTLIDGRKVPMSPLTGKGARSNDPTTWTTANEAWAAKTRRRWGGLNFALTLSAGIVGIDLDDCFEECDGQRQLKDYARQIVGMLDTYTEVSPSGNGLHLFALGSIPGNVHRAEDGFEMYADRHFLTVTGRHLGSPRNIEERNDALNALYVTFHVEPEAPPAAGPLSGTNDRYTQAALMRAMQAASLAVNGARNHTLFTETAALVELVNSGAIGRGDVERVMTAAGLAAGLKQEETVATIASAFKSVTKARPVPPPRPRYQPIEDAV